MIRSALLLLFLCASLRARVIDLGKLEIKTKNRGPEVQLIDTGRLSASSAAAMIRFQLKGLETRLLAPKPPRIDKKGEER